MRIVFLGLSITSSWGNGHATNYRGLVRALARRGHEVLFLERDVPWYAAHRDLTDSSWGRVALYRSLDELGRFAAHLREAQLVVVGSYVPEGAAVAAWVLETAGGLVAFYDIDTPVTVEGLEAGGSDYLTRELVPAFDLYLSFTGGPLLERLEREFGARRAEPFYCLVDEDRYRPLAAERRYELGYLGTYSVDRQPALEALLLAPARLAPKLRFAVAGPQYPDGIEWPENVERVEHLPPGRHPGFYAAQAYSLNVTRAQMARAGWSPSVRLFEAAACAVPVISDAWEGLDRFFEPGREILVAHGPEDVLGYLTELPDRERLAIGERARRRVLSEHTAARRAGELEAHVAALAGAAAA